jgi:hypothetical protein
MSAELARLAVQTANPAILQCVFFAIQVSIQMEQIANPVVLPCLPASYATLLLSAYSVLPNTTPIVPIYVNHVLWAVQHAKVQITVRAALSDTFMLPLPTFVSYALVYAQPATVLLHSVFPA